MHNLLFSISPSSKPFQAQSLFNSSLELQSAAVYLLGLKFTKIELPILLKSWPREDNFFTLLIPMLKRNYYQDTHFKLIFISVMKIGTYPLIFSFLVCQATYYVNLYFNWLDYEWN